MTGGPPPDIIAARACIPRGRFSIVTPARRPDGARGCFWKSFRSCSGFVFSRRRSRYNCRWTAVGENNRAIIIITTGTVGNREPTWKYILRRGKFSPDKRRNRIEHNLNYIDSAVVRGIRDPINPPRIRLRQYRVGFRIGRQKQTLFFCHQNCPNTAYIKY